MTGRREIAETSKPCGGRDGWCLTETDAVSIEGVQVTSWPIERIAQAVRTSEAAKRQSDATPRLFAAAAMRWSMIGRTARPPFTGRQGRYGRSRPRRETRASA